MIGNHGLQQPVATTGCGTVTAFGAPIPERFGLCATALPDEVLQSPTPVLLRGLVGHWPAVQAAMISAAAISEYLLRFYRGVPVTVLRAPVTAKGRIFYNETFTGFNFQRDAATLDQLLAELSADAAGETRYVGSTTLEHCLPGFAADNTLTALAEKQALVSIWLGNRSVVSAHFDLPSNLACVVAGRRRFTLFPPEQIDNLYVGPFELTPAGQPISLVDFADIDFDRFPRFRTAMAHAMTAELGAGDALFIPSLWWHHIAALDDLNVLVNYWWGSAGIQSESPINALLHAVLALGPLGTQQKRSLKALFEHYVFAESLERFEHIPPTIRGLLDASDENSSRRLRAYLYNALKR